MVKQSSRKFYITIVVFGVVILGASYLHMANGVFDMSVLDVVKTIFRIEKNEQLI